MNGKAYLPNVQSNIVQNDVVPNMLCGIVLFEHVCEISSKNNKDNNS